MTVTVSTDIIAGVHPGPQVEGRMPRWIVDARFLLGGTSRGGDQGVLDMTRLLTKSMAALALAIILLPASIGLAAMQRAQTKADLDHSLRADATDETQVLTNYFERARSIDLLTANNAVFRDFYLGRGTRSEKLRDEDLRHGTNQAPTADPR